MKGRETSEDRHPESPTPPARLETIVKTGIQRAGHHQPDWETNEFGHIQNSEDTWKKGETS